MLMCNIVILTNVLFVGKTSHPIICFLSTFRKNMTPISTYFQKSVHHLYVWLKAVIFCPRTAKNELNILFEIINIQHPFNSTLDYRSTLNK
mmetsp:Transcript_4729/g.6491  ORF Transcript_4729/g.6491 Transcript_4729/m.6491 type:complete len:91 (+) Transcript_4729:199-471(+)